ncbi:MAG: hypothetical protein CML66_15825 [Rhodobacteraceae bacterium]|nr:hypothetical protein [Paracoccaceae bacterium]MAY44497.1 hypothetical protein [Paracoccaceae bacterium]
MTPFVKIVTTALALSGWATLAAASDAPARVLQIPPGLCPQTIATMTDWARTTQLTGIGAFSLPFDPEAKIGDCDTVTLAQGSAVTGYATNQDAANAAIAACETTRAAGLGECRVYAYLRQQ